MRWFFVMLLFLTTLWQIPVVAESAAPSGIVLKEDLETVQETLAFDEEGFNWRQDWWKYLTLLLGMLLALLLAVRLTKMLFRLLLFLVCLAASVGGAIGLQPLLLPWVQKFAPAWEMPVFRPEHLAYAVGFLLSYLICTFLLGILTKTFTSPKKA